MIDPEKQEQLQKLLAELDDRQVGELYEDLISTRATDLQKIATIVNLVASLTPAFRAELEAQLGIPAQTKQEPPRPMPSTILGMDGKPINQPKHISKAAAGADPQMGLLDVKVEGNGTIVQITFDRDVRFIAMPVGQGLQFAMLIMESCGAKIDRTVIPQTPQGAPPS